MSESEAKLDRAEDGSVSLGRAPDSMILILRFAVFGVCAVCVGVALHTVFSGRWQQLSPVGIGVLVVIPAIFGVVLGIAGTKLPKERFPLLALELCSLGAVLFMAEYTLAAFFPVSDDIITNKKIVARQFGVPFDGRTVSQVIDGLAERGVTAYPAFPVAWLDARDAMKQPLAKSIYPLSNISNSKIVACNETGKYLIFESDAYGFHNPPGLQARRPVQVAALGSSFVLGNCVESGRNMVARIREQFSATLNFGMAYTSAISNLGIFREYVEPLRPRVVLWFIYNEDFRIRDEAKNSILKRYFDPSFHQGLRQRQAEVDALLKRALPDIVRRDDQWRDALLAEHEAGLLWWRNAIVLTQIRKRLLPASLESENWKPDLGPMAESLKLVRETVARWGGRLYAVYIPDYVEAVLDQPHAGLRLRDVAPLLARLDIPLIDALSPISRDGDPARFYTMRSVNHFNPVGYQLIADIVVRRLRADLGRKL